MVSATCEACGTEHRVPETLVPPSGKIMKCTSCGKPVTVMPPGARAMGFGPGKGKPPPIPPKRPATPSPVGPPPPAPAAPPKPDLTSGPALAEFENDGDGLADALELDDGFLGGSALGDVEPAARPSPLAGADPVAGAPTPTSALADAGSFFDNLPAPVGPSPIGVEDLPAPVGPSPIGIEDLPAPVGPSPIGIEDLPAPVGPSGGGGFFEDLPAPVGPTSRNTDLPAPVGPSGGGGFFEDLPAPVGPTSRNTDLPTPVGPTSRNTDLPTPVGPTSRNTDLLTPVGPTSRNTNLPTPVGPTSRNTNLPTPVGPTSRNTDLLTPVGPTSRNTDLPAPKGFFDDIPGPADAGAPSTSGKLPAPKGFFDDIPGPAETRGSGGPGNLPAPKGFFDDIPGPAHHDRERDTPQLDALDLSEPIDLGSSSTPLALGGSPAQAAGPADAARGFFDDIAGGDSGALDLDDLDLAPPQSAAAPSLDLNDPGDAPALDLGRDASFGGIDLPKDDGLSLSVPPPARAGGAFAPRPEQQDDLLDLDADAVAEQQARTAAAAKRTKTATAAAEEATKQRSKTPLIVVAAILLLGALGAGGWFLWTRHQAAAARKTEVAQHLTAARRFLASDKPGHWDAARDQADEALEVDGNNADALGIAAQAAYAGYLDEGTHFEARRDAGRAYIARINHAAAAGAEDDKAEALRAIFEGSPKGALTPLGHAQRAQPGDPNIPLYQGWAYQAMHDHKNALSAFKRALQVSADRIPALYGLGRAQQALGNAAEARKAYDALRKRDASYKDLPGHVDHFGALVGSYQLADVRRFADRENLYLEITNHPQVKEGDPRAVSLAWSLAGNQALLARRVNEARRRYTKAKALDANNQVAQVGEARADLAQGLLDDARRKLEAVLADDPTDIDATMALAEVAVKQGKPDEAQSLVTPLLGRDPPLDNQYELGRLHVVQGDILAANGDDKLADAIAEYRMAVSLIPPDQDIRPTVELAKALARDPDPTHAAEAKDLLAPITDRAKSEPALAVTLGLAYRAAGDAARAEEWFRTALAARPNDVEALYQLGQALFDKKAYDEAIDSLKKAFAEGNREDIGRQLAMFYEQLGRDDEAAQIYDQLLNVKNPSINVRARAGRFYARIGNADGATAMGDSILAEAPNNAAGLFLKGEAMLGAGKVVNAVRFFRQATSTSGEPQFFDGLGRAYLALDPPRMGDAIDAFKQAAVKEDFLSPRLGIVCARLMRRDYRADITKVTDAIDKARALDPKNAWLYYAEGEVYQGTGDQKRAIRAYHQAIHLGLPKKRVHAFVEFLLGIAAKDIDSRSEAASALASATSTYEQLVRSGDKGGDVDHCPLALTSRWAHPKSAGQEPPWITEAYRSLGYVQRARGNRGAAIRAWETYLGRDPSDRDEAMDIKRLLMNLEGH